MKCIELDFISVTIYLIIYIDFSLIFSGVGQIEEIKNHSFFVTIEWDDLSHKKLDPPFKPTIVPDETFHFDSSFTSKTPKGKARKIFSNSYNLTSRVPHGL